MKKSLLGLVGLCLAQAALAQKPSGTEETYQRVEATFSQTADVESLRDNPQFMAELKKVIGAADELAAKTIVDHSTFVFMNGLLADVGAAIGKMPKAVLESENGAKATNLYKWYNLNGIPAIFLVDGNGTIVAKKLRGSKIRETVVEYLNNH